MVSSVWIGSAQTSVIWFSGSTAVSNVEFTWANVPSDKGLTVSAQAALSGFGYAVEPGPTLPFGTASALIKAYRSEPGSPFVLVNAPTLNNVTAVEIIFELSVTAFEGQGTGVEATMIGTVFIQ